MSHKVDIAEVNEFSQSLKSASNDIALGIDSVINDIHQIRSMESFSGSAATTAKNYFGELHISLSDAFKTLFLLLHEHINKHLEQFESSVDSDQSAIVQSEYLQTVRQTVDIECKVLIGCQRDVCNVIDDISDIITITKPSSYSLVTLHREIINLMEELDRNLNNFTSKGKGHDQTAKDIIHHIEVIMTKAKAQTGEARFSDFKSGTADKDLLQTKDLLSYLSKMDTLLEKAKESITDYAHYKQVSPYNPPKVQAHPSSSSTVDKAKHVAKQTGKDGLKSAKNMVPGLGKGATKALGPLSAGLTYYSNYHDAQAAGLTGKDAHVRAVEDTVIDTVVSGGVQGFFTAVGTVAIPIPGVGTAAGVAVGMLVNGVFNIKFGKKQKSIMDRIKGGFRKLKSWFS